MRGYVKIQTSYNDPQLGFTPLARWLHLHSKTKSTATMNQSTTTTENNQVLKPRETEILHLASKGLTTRETGQQLYLSTETVETYRKEVYKKTGASNITEAVAMALRNGWID